MNFISLPNSRELHYLAFGDIHLEQPMIFLHGIMGNKKNLSGFVQRLLAQCPNKSGLIFDLRNHGQSSKHWAPFTVQACADDIKAACQALQISPKKIIGHSFGGKVALLSAEMISSVEELWLLDCAPGSVEKFTSFHPRQSCSALDIIETLSALNWQGPSRKDLVDRLMERGISQGIAAWMTTNLTAGPHGLQLVFEPREMKALLTDFMALDAWPLIKPLSERMAIHLVAAEHGRRLSKDDEIRLLSLAGHGRGFFHVVNNAGHFLHADNPEGLMDIMTTFCN